MLPKPSWVKISQIRTISVERLGKRIAAVEPETIDRLVDGLVEPIGSSAHFSSASSTTSSIIFT